MALSNFTKDMAIVAQLADEPNLDGGIGHPDPYTASELKDVFDEGGKAIKTYINDTLVPYVNGENIDTEQLIDGSVMTDKLADGAVTSAKIGSKEVKTVNIDDGAVDTTQLADGSVTTPKIADGNVTTDKLDDSAVTSAKLASGAVTGGKIASSAVTTAKINDKAVTKAKLEDSVQTSLGKADTAYQKPGSGIPQTDLASAVQTSLGKADSAYQKPGAGIPAADIADGAVTTAKLANEAVTNAKLAQGAVKSYNIAAGTIERSDLAADANDIYWAEYGTTYPVEIAEAVNSGRLPACLYNNRVYVHVKYVPGYPDDRASKHYFSSLDSDGTMYYLVCEVVSSTLTWSNGSIDLTSGGGGGGTTEIFLATYGTTSANDIETAYQAGKTILCKADGASFSFPSGSVIILPLYARVEATSFIFTSSFNDSSNGKIYTVTVNLADGWAYSSKAFPIPQAAGTPEPLGTANMGSSTQYSRKDHVHPMPSAADVGAYALPAGGIPATDLASAVQTSLGKADTAEQPVTEVTISTAGAVTQALDAGKIYHFTGALTSLTITLNAASGLAHYHFDFDCGSTAPTVTIPATVTMPDGNSFDASKHYEVDILNGYGAVLSWANS